jgi:internalin A
MAPRKDSKHNSDKEPSAQRRRERFLQPPEFTVLGDAPLTTEDTAADSFDLGQRVGPIYDILRHPATPTPMTIAIYGDWGAGKTSAMKWLEGQLEAWKQEGKAEDKRIVHACWFYPWKYHSREEVWRGLIAQIIIACLKAKPAPRTSRIKHLLPRVLMDLFSGFRISLGLPQVATAEFDAVAFKKIQDGIQEFLSPQNAYLSEFEEVINDWVGTTLGERERMVVFIDDLDRCLPQIALQVLEALKLYLDIDKLIFVVGVDRRVVDDLVSNHYEKLGLSAEKTGNYLAKMFTEEVTVGPTDLQIDTFLNVLLEKSEAWGMLGETEQKIFHRVVRNLAKPSTREASSPREVKRLIDGALIAGAGARMSALGDATDKRPLTPAEGIQVFLVWRVLRDRYYGYGSLVRQAVGTKFFKTWSRIVIGDRDVARTVAVPSDYVERLTQERGTVALDATSGGTLDQALSEFPTAYHELLKKPSFAGLFNLLGDEDLAELMRLPYPEEAAAAIRGVLGEGGAAAFVREAVAKALGKPIEELKTKDWQGLTSLDLDGMEIKDLTPLKDLTALKRLSLQRTHVSNLEPLKGLTSLQELNLGHTQVSNLDPLKDLTALVRLNLQRTQVSHLEPLKGLTSLQQLDLRATVASNLEPLKGLTALQELRLAVTEVSDLGPLEGLTSLQELNLHGTKVSDLGPLGGLTALQELNLKTARQVSNLEPLKGLAGLKTLRLTGTQVSNLEPLKCLTSLNMLGLYGTQVSDLGPLEGLTALQVLDLADTQVSNQELEPLKGLIALQTLSLANTDITNLDPLKGLTSLHWLSLEETKVSNLEPLKGLVALEELDLAGTQAKKEDIDALQEALPNLKIVLEAQGLW